MLHSSLTTPFAAPLRPSASLALGLLLALTPGCEVGTYEEGDEAGSGSTSPVNGTPLSDSVLGQGGSNSGGSASPVAPSEPAVDACAGAGAGVSAAQPFGSHARPYASGATVPDHLSSDQLDQSVRDFHDRWKRRYLKQGCAAGHYYVATGIEGSETVSEAHGYGMLITAYMAGHDPEAHAVFDGLHAYYAAHPSEGLPPLMAWSQDASCNNNKGAGSASDGDLDIAYALLLADKQWGSDGAIDYQAEALKLLDAVLREEVDRTDSYILLGDWTSPNGRDTYYATRSSDFMPGHLEAFAVATGNPIWTQILDRTYQTLEQVQSQYAAGTGLVPDFILEPTGVPKPADPGFLENDSDGSYSFNACRVPWRVGVHFLTHGDARARSLLLPLQDWLHGRTGGSPSNIGAGYWLDGDSLPRTEYKSMAFVGPFAVGAMVDSDRQQWVNALWDDMDLSESGNDYYGETLKMLSMIALSGNWWSPDLTPCP